MPTLFRQSDGDVSLPTRAPEKSVVKRRTLLTPLTCFAVSPTGIRFETQEDEEQIVLFLREHLITQVPPVLLTLLMIVAPLLVFPLIPHMVKVPVTFHAGYFVVGTIFWYVMTFGLAIMNFLRWYYNIYIVTNKRIVDIDFMHLLYKEFSEARIEKIQDISFKSGGILAAFFDYGDVFVETAAEMPNLEYSNVPKPDEVVETISKLLEDMPKQSL
jgi:hypothetical protein